MSDELSPAKVRLTAGLDPVVPRWYCMTRDGLMTLCVNEKDARWLAAECDRDWPEDAPHRAVLLGDVAAERERCAKLCDEYAAGFGGVAAGHIATTFGKAIHEAMAAGAMNCAAAIRETEP